MAVIFLLGPGSWDKDKGEPPAHTPLDVRKNIASALRKDGHTIILMEAAPDVNGETILQKFDRLLRQHVSMHFALAGHSEMYGRLSASTIS